MPELQLTLLIADPLMYWNLLGLELNVVNQSRQGCLQTQESIHSKRWQGWFLWVDCNSGHCKNLNYCHKSNDFVREAGSYPVATPKLLLWKGRARHKMAAVGSGNQKWLFPSQTFFCDGRAISQLALPTDRKVMPPEVFWNTILLLWGEGEPRVAICFVEEALWGKNTSGHLEAHEWGCS